MGYRDYSTAKGHIVDATGQGDFTTIQAGITAASSGQTVFVRPGTYVENVTHKAGVNLTALPGDGRSGNVILKGKLTISGVGTFQVGTIQLQTNSDFALEISGSSATVAHFNGTTIVGSDNTAISYTTSNASSSVSFLGCTLDLTTTGITYWSQSSTGGLNFYSSDLENSGSSTTATSNSSGNVGLFNCVCAAPFSTSSTGILTGLNSSFITSPLNTTSITTAGTGASHNFFECSFICGTASAISIGSGTTLSLYNSTVSSSNANVITGAGTLVFGGVTFPSTTKVNTTTQTYNYFSLVNQTFTASGTYTPTTGMKYCKVRIVGGGGAGGGAGATAPTTGSCGSGGGAGEYAEGTFSAATVGTSQSVTIAAAATGVSAAAGSNGGTCSLGALITAAGGSGGLAGAVAATSNAAGSLGGTGGSGGSFRTPGAPGFNGYTSVAGIQITGGHGGSSQFGAGGRTSNSGVNNQGEAGLGYGSGGAGSSNFTSQSALAGGNGTSGIVVIDEYVIN